MGEQVKMEQLSPEVVKDTAALKKWGITHGLIYEHHQVLLKEVETLDLASLQIKEAYFFGPFSQIHCYRAPEPKTIIMKECETASDYQDETMYLMQNDTVLRPFQKITTRSYISYDEDGQAYVAAKRILSVE